jgi:hypothetical protein
VTDWYNQTYAAGMRSAMAEGDFSNVAPINWEITPAGDGGSRIIVLCP